ncbi:flagellar hook-associated protein FlgK [Paeniglutamicibacter sp. NPDC091659]|uniref:flagellar hook-associated protein FlgK n=1 Tax=Paeniglutamicibacter sp. NPDC091659 TaxID=3364389 RepID=UPI00382172DF
MSTFSGLNTAMTGLNAARLAMETAGNNLANVGTKGYTRQRADFASVGSLAHTGLLTSRNGVGQGVALTGIARLSDAHLEARVRGTSAFASQSDVRAEGLSNLEGVLREPGENGLSALLNDFWAGWEDVAGQPGATSPAAVLLERAKAVVDRISVSHTEISTQWGAQRQNLDTMASEVNAAATAISDLNGQIRSSLAAGGTPNALLDQRALLSDRIAELTGATVRESPDGTIDVLINGNALVSGNTVRPVEITGGLSMADGAAPTLQWAHRPGDSIGLESGRIAGVISLLAPANASGTGGALAESAKSLNTIAMELATRVNDVQSNGVTVEGLQGQDFFSFDPANPASSIKVIATGPKDLATGTAGGGALDGSNASAMAQLGKAKDGPDALWANMVIKIGVATKSEAQQAVSTAVSAASAQAAQYSVSAVSLDEENVALLAHQHAFQGAARVMTAVDEMLDTLINRTGLVGR